MKERLFDQFLPRRVLEAGTTASGGHVMGSLKSTQPARIQGGGSSGSDDRETVRAGRRRRAEPAGPEGRQRAEAPRRREPSGQGPGGGGRPPSMPSMPGGGRRLSLPMLILLVVIAICYYSVNFMLGGQGVDQPTGELDQPAADLVEPTTELAAAATNTPRARRTPTPTRPAVAVPQGSAGEQTWLVMLYQDADDKILEQDIYVDLNEVERVGSSERVQIVAEFDRFRAGYQGDGDWQSARRYFVTQDDDLQSVNSEMVADLGEVNMSDGDTLVDFVTWAVESYPADKYVLILSDHGMGWPGGWSDPAPGGRGDPNIPLASRLGDELYLNELDQALGDIRAQTGIDKFELVGMDACLMGHLEVFSALAPHARYAVASQEVEPALGWAYTGFLDGLVKNPAMDGAALARLIVDSYITDDQRIVDDQARAEMLRQGSPMGGLFSLLGSVTPEQLAQQMEQTVTLAAVDLRALPELISSVNDLSYSLQKARQADIARARSYAQSFTSIFGSEVPPSYIDLGSFVSLIQEKISRQDVSQAGDRVQAALREAVIAEKHGSKKAGATGVSIYFPNAQLYQSPVTGAESYTAIASRFASESLWDDFLASHYTGSSFEADTGEVAVPPSGSTVRGPGAETIVLSPITLSAPSASPSRPVLLSTDILGQNIGYVYLFAGFYDQASNSIFMADMDYLESAETRQIDGVYYPVWPETGDFTMEFEWEPLVFAINDGQNSVVALFKPQSYGASFEQAIYTVDGTFTYADGGETRNARLLFSDGLLRQVLGFTGEGETGAPREIIPQPGDQFTVQESWLDLDQSGNVVARATQAGDTLTFGDQPFRWEALDAAPGEYIVGFVAEDLDGNSYQVYERVTVE